jgi:hypothetical protein
LNWEEPCTSPKTEWRQWGHGPVLAKLLHKRPNLADAAIGKVGLQPWVSYGNVSAESWVS